MRACETRLLADFSFFLSLFVAKRLTSQILLNCACYTVNTRQAEVSIRTVNKKCGGGVNEEECIDAKTRKVNKENYSPKSITKAFSNSLRVVRWTSVVAISSPYPNFSKRLVLAPRELAAFHTNMLFSVRLDDRRFSLLCSCAPCRFRLDGSEWFLGGCLHCESHV